MIKIKRGEKKIKNKKSGRKGMISRKRRGRKRKS